MLILQGLLDRTRDEGTASAHADSPIQRLDEIILEGNVHSHGHIVAHSAGAAPVIALHATISVVHRSGGIRIDEARRRLRQLPSPLPAGPAVLDPVVVGQFVAWPDWMRPTAGVAPRDAAGLVLLVPGPDGEAHVILTERPAGGMRHPGQISLPGGAAEPADDFPVGTALREAREEIGLDPVAAGVEILGTLDVVDVRVSGFMLVPVIAVAARVPALSRHEREVAAILSVPVSTFLPGAPIRIVETERDGYRLRYGAFPFGDHQIWGATARVLGQLGALLDGSRRAARRS
ncbi:MAG: CoA pyrophosphatase [Chloroflexota bacterium]|nr:CoA pyrophosphatase [Chloroflexota bacterium]